MALTKRYPNGVQTLKVKGEVGFLPGQIEADPHTAAKGIQIDFAMKLVATAAASGGLGAKRKELFEGIYIDFSTGPKEERDRTPFLQEANLVQVARMQKALLEKSIEGFDDTSMGLAQPLVQGENTLKWSIIIPAGKVETILPKRGIFGMGAAQLKTAALRVKLPTDTLRAADATLEIKELTCAFGPYEEEQVNGEQWCDPPVLHTQKESAEKDTTALPDGCWIRVSDVNKPLATHDFGTLTVKIGDRVKYEEASPQDIYTDWANLPDTGATEDTSDETTPVYWTSDTPLKNMETGPVTIKQRKRVGGALVAFSIEAYGFRPKSVDKVLQEVALVAAQLPPGKVIKAINVVALEPSLQTESRHNWILGWRVFMPDERQFGLYAGLKCESGKLPELDIPAARLHRAAVAYAEAKVRGGVEGDATAEEVIRSIADEVPGAVVTGRGYKGAITSLYRQVKDTIEAYILAVQQQANGAA